MPRLVPHCQWDSDITEVEGAHQQAGRPYPVAPQHLPELNRQVEALEKAGIKREPQPEAAVSVRTLVTFVTWLISRTQFSTSEIFLQRHFC